MDKFTSESLSTSFSLTLVSVSLELAGQGSQTVEPTAVSKSESIWHPKSTDKHATYTSQQVNATTMAQHSMVATATVGTQLPRPQSREKSTIVAKPRQSVVKDTLTGIANLMGFGQH